jgi:oligopeptide/dipeptide ABC transporter ATP-binding protein
VTTAPPLLAIDDLRVAFDGPDGPAHVLQGVSFDVADGSLTGLVGESGSGKSLTALTMMRLAPERARVLAGDVRLGDLDLLRCDDATLERARGKDISIVFQNALASLDPLLTVGEQIAQVYRAHEPVSPEQARDMAVEMLDRMGIANPRQRAASYPHEYSGGMAQRAMLAMALVCRPRLLVADEPTTGLDVTVQAQVLDVIVESVRSIGAALLLISHDLRVVGDVCDHVVVMYAGTVVEAGSVDEVLTRPAHPYTRALLRCVQPSRDGRMAFIPGRVPTSGAEHVGCPFADRCEHVHDRWRHERPSLRANDGGRVTACHLLEGGMTP